MPESVNAALKRKLSIGKEDNRDRTRSVLRALRLALAPAAGDCLSLPLTVIGAKQSTRSPEDLTGSIDDTWLLLQLVNDGHVAAACLDPNAVSAIVQAQTIGEVTTEPPVPRGFTDTDAAMVAPLIEETLSRAIHLVDADDDRACLMGYEFTSRLASPRSLGLAMIDDGYRVFDLTVELAGGVRQGLIAVVLPDCPDEPVSGEAEQDSAGPNLQQASSVLRAELNSVICRMTLPLTALSDLVEGDVLPLAGARLDRTEMLTIDRTCAAVGRLGQCGGMRAVRLNEQASLTALKGADEPEFLESKPAVSNGGAPVAPEPVINGPDINDHGSGAGYVEDEVSFASSEQMAAEISQLAGLPAPGDETGRSG